MYAKMNPTPIRHPIVQTVEFQNGWSDDDEPCHGNPGLRFCVCNPSLAGPFRRRGLEKLLNRVMHQTSVWCFFCFRWTTIYINAKNKHTLTERQNQSGEAKRSP